MTWAKKAIDLIEENLTMETVALNSDRGKRLVNSWVEDLQALFNNDANRYNEKEIREVAEKYLSAFDEDDRVEAMRTALRECDRKSFDI